MTLIDGKAISSKVLGECRTEIDSLKTSGITPGLAVVIVGDDPASQAYVGSKVRTCRDLGMHSQHIALPAATSQDDLLAVIHSLNADPAIHGILVQSPPPPHINEAEIVRTIRPDKDVDGFHPENVAKLTMESPDAFVPCTPLGCQRLLLEYQIPTAGARVVVIGRSMIVGKPLALLLMARGPGGDATVTIAHSRTRDLPAVCREADILIAAIGRPRFVTPEFIRPGAVVIDVGINRVPDATAKNGYRITGDVDFEAVAPLCSAITPVPGGVGPMTIAMLIGNTLKATRQQHGLPPIRP
ncbi:MAG: bifunctional methylenetetrahydrofolate dehydrogenase/methenyltetrahydrofolate cyclohydrolase FolD [Verrucomicrobiota bacterium]|jgi:methylenetetrahydrofolate dehydrogenase (NADP+)/methenyltetrahydrofolate cyclohydrolase